MDTFTKRNYSWPCYLLNDFDEEAFQIWYKPLPYLDRFAYFQMLEVALVPFRRIASVLNNEAPLCLLSRGVPLNGWTRQHRPVPSSVRRTRWGMLIMGECPQPSSNFTIYYAFLHFHSCLILYPPTDTSYSQYSTSVKPNIPYGQLSAKLPVIQAFGSFGSFGWSLSMLQQTH